MKKLILPIALVGCLMSTFTAPLLADDTQATQARMAAMKTQMAEMLKTDEGCTMMCNEMMQNPKSKKMMTEMIMKDPESMKMMKMEHK